MEGIMRKQKKYLKKPLSILSICLLCLSAFFFSGNTSCGLPPAPEELKNNGESCQQASECKSQNCEEGSCKQGKKAGGTACQNHAECASQNCTSKDINDPDNKTCIDSP